MSVSVGIGQNEKSNRDDFVWVTLNFPIVNKSEPDSRWCILPLILPIVKKSVQFNFIRFEKYTKVYS